MKSDTTPRKVVPYDEFRKKQRERQYGKRNGLPILTPEQITEVCTPEVDYDDESPSQSWPYFPSTHPRED